jgi:preprotein translocase SecE subunit
MMFNIYKTGQGKYTRLGTGFLLGLIVVIGCLRLYDLLGVLNLGLWVETMIPAGLFVVLALLIVWLVNKPSFADFMISAEGEMKKVNWSSKQEIAVSTFVVIIVVVFFAVLLGLIDLLFTIFFTWLLGG